MTPPQLTIGVPVYNGERYLAKALDILLAQTIQDYEIVLSDNGSRDRTAEICQAYLARDSRIRYVRYERTVSPVANFCRTLEHARGRYFTWTAVDDVRPADALGACVAALEASPAAVMAHGPVIADCIRLGTTVLIEHRMDLTQPDAAERIKTFTQQMQYNAMLYGVYRIEALRKAIFRQHPGHDYLLPMQMCLLGPLAYSAAPMLIYQHVWGETDTPMYKLQPLTLRDLLIYRGVRRKKCWITLVLGALYLLRMPEISLRARVAGAAAHITEFIRRYPAHLRTEAFFLAATPAAWVCGPFAPAGRRLKRLLLAKAPGS
jgi:glycosyltransferase involved in cell wall biosynthesis